MVGWNMILVYLNLGLVLALPKKETNRNYQNGEQSNHHEHQCNPENINQAFIRTYSVCIPPVIFGPRQNLVNRYIRSIPLVSH